jgi:hypothetical protein
MNQFIITEKKDRVQFLQSEFSKLVEVDRAQRSRIQDEMRALLKEDLMRQREFVSAVRDLKDTSQLVRLMKKLALELSTCKASKISAVNARKAMDEQGVSGIESIQNFIMHFLTELKDNYSSISISCEGHFKSEMLKLKTLCKDYSRLLRQAIEQKAIQLEDVKAELLQVHQMEEQARKRNRLDRAQRFQEDIETLRKEEESVTSDLEKLKERLAYIDCLPKTLSS